MDAKLKHNELKLLVENLNSQLNQKVEFQLNDWLSDFSFYYLFNFKDQDRRNMIKKEYGYDDALLSLQNDINDLETK